MDQMQVQGQTIKVITANTVVVGAGAAALNAADSLHALGMCDVVIVCEDFLASTSRNAGSDKQTYYKLALAGGECDSIYEMAQTLMDGQCVDGDIALTEAANSVSAFIKLCGLGVPFPVNRYGEYVGYKTDHDPRRRATSAGPLTSRLMVEALEKSIMAKNITIFSGMLAVSILTLDGHVEGLLCLDLKRLERGKVGYTAFNCANIIWATGGPAGMYADTSYPPGQHGSIGVALQAGARGRNLTEWQYGLSSVSPKWNVSGTYMQALPRFISTDSNGDDGKEFLKPYFASCGDMLYRVFLKGYQWPFDVRRAMGGSSLIDLLVYAERCIQGRRVFLDFRNNSGGAGLDYNALTDEAKDYLEQAGALFGNPIDRLIHMNAPAYEFYLCRGVDLKKDMLEIALCAQHNNGGLAVDCWWQTNVVGLFAVGEAAATHGVYRPGGSALNAGQVGAMRAAQFIAAKRNGKPTAAEGFAQATEQQIDRMISWGDRTLTQKDSVDRLTCEAQRDMSRVGAAMRDAVNIAALIAETRTRIEQLDSSAGCSVGTLGQMFRYRDMLISQYVYLCAMSDFIDNGGKSRGSALYFDEAGDKPHEKLGSAFSFTVDEGGLGQMIQETVCQNGICRFEWRKARPMPTGNDFFENVWRDYREHGGIY